LKPPTGVSSQIASGSWLLGLKAVKKMGGAPLEAELWRLKGEALLAIPEYEMALSFNPNAVWSLHSLAYCKFFAGSIEEAISLEEQAIRLSPRDPFIGVWYRQIGLAHLVQSRTNEAVVWLEKARNLAQLRTLIGQLPADPLGDIVFCRADPADRTFQSFRQKS
jgi:tetratricopeptide (TPR) repeat protein